MILLVVDTQRLITNENLYSFDLFVSNVRLLIAKARQNNLEVIYVRHDDGEGTELTKGLEGFEIDERFNPQPKDRVFDKSVNSIFQDTELLEYLTGKDERELIIVGLQTDYCIDASVKCGFEHGFNIIVPAYSNTTVDNSYMTAEQSYKYHNELMWNKRYAECISVEETVKRMR